MISITQHTSKLRMQLANKHMLVICGLRKSNAHKMIYRQLSNKSNNLLFTLFKAAVAQSSAKAEQSAT